MPPAKRPNKDPMPSHRPTPEQYAAMMAAAAAAGQPFPRHHVSILLDLFLNNFLITPQPLRRNDQTEGLTKRFRTSRENLKLRKISNCSAGP